MQFKTFHISRSKEEHNLYSGQEVAIQMEKVFISHQVMKTNGFHSGENKKVHGAYRESFNPEKTIDR